MQTWLFQCNPNRFRIDQFLATRPTETNWLVRQYANRIVPGDQVFIWRAIGDGPPDASGIVAEAEVLTSIAPMPENPAEQPFWVDQAEANQLRPRVALRIVRIADQRTMIRRPQIRDDPILRNLRILKLANSTNYSVAADQATRLNELWDAEGSADRNPPWVRDELILALNMYLRCAGNPPGKESTEIVELSETLNRLARYLGLTRANRFRNVNGVYMKLMNFRRFDPAFIGAGKVGLTRGGKAEEDVWNHFAHDPALCHAVAETIRRTLVATPESEIAADFFDSGVEEADEGRLITSLHRRYERNAAIVKSKKARVFATEGKLACEVCEFDFEQHYGERGEGFIECHHTKPPSELKEGEKTKIKDLRLVCSNCHRMVHARRPWLAIDELRSLFRKSA